MACGVRVWPIKYKTDSLVKTLKCPSQQEPACGVTLTVGGVLVNREDSLAMIGLGGIYINLSITNSFFFLRNSLTRRNEFPYIYFSNG